MRESRSRLKCVMRECDRSGVRYPAGRRRQRRDAVRDAEGGAAAPVPRPRAGRLAAGLAGGRRTRGGGERRSHQLPQTVGLPPGRCRGYLRRPHHRTGPGRREERPLAPQNRQDRGTAQQHRSQEDTSP